MTVTAPEKRPTLDAWKTLKTEERAELLRALRDEPGVVSRQMHGQIEIARNEMEAGLLLFEQLLDGLANDA
jgi:hypothetical protein